MEVHAKVGVHLLADDVSLASDVSDDAVGGVVETFGQ